MLIYRFCLNILLPKKKGGEKKPTLSLGVMYLISRGVIQDYVEAYAWYNVASAYGVKDAVKMRDLIKKEMGIAQIAEGQKRSREITSTISKN
ncbi:MAG: hypothetical protein CMJ20_07855 [Phycisphaeraceae bacterium]|nr:hypothetical protein [Phycisphaeraceae bacterium]